MPNRLDNFNGIKEVVSTVLENSHILITPTTFGIGGPFVLTYLQAFNFDTSNPYMILVFDATTVPANGTVTPAYWTYVPVATSTVPGFIGVEYFYPKRFTNGIVVAGSTTVTTPFTLALATASELAFDAQVAY
jgi:hypothetical protein